MRLTTKDAVGIVLVTGTLGALFIHNGPFGHRASHQGPIADAGGSVTSAASTPITAFVDFNVVPMDGDVVLRHQVVIVEGGFVRRIGPLGVVEPPAGVRRIEGGGTRYLAPGLTDAHVHLPTGAESWLPLFIAHGVTTVFNLEGRERHLDLRDRIGRGELLGPTLYTAGPFLQEPGIRTAEEARREVARQADRGYDFVKVHGDLSAEAFAALTSAGRSEGIAVIGHAPRNLPFASVLENGQAGVSHAEELIYTHLVSLDQNELMGVATAMAEAGTWLTPTVAHFETIVSQWGAPAGIEERLASEAARYLPPALRADWREGNPYVVMDPDGQGRIAEMYEFHAPMIRALHGAGVPMLAGTDTPLPAMVPGSSLHNEIEALAEIGMTGFQALETATANAGRFIQEYVNAAVLFGTIREGARADLVMVDEDPRERTSVLRRPEGVMVRGQWFDRGDLDRMLATVAANQ